MKPIDIWRSAKLLVDQHGKDAPIHAAMRADELLEKGDLDGERIWLAIKRACETLLLDKKPEGVPVN